MINVCVRCGRDAGMMRRLNGNPRHLLCCRCYALVTIRGVRRGYQRRHTGWSVRIQDSPAIHDLYPY
jgi:hypothetical protein